MKTTNDLFYPDPVGQPGLYEIIPLLKESQLRAGDIVPFSDEAWYVEKTDGKDGGRITYSSIGKGGWRGPPWEEPINDVAMFDFKHVARPVAATPAESQPKKDSSLWNGSCSRCGKGTYTGAFSVEHEGGGCP